ncbi:MAG: biopolymer transporter ExbD [Planctomycetes bacterium]|nr:biopolymer transporter ExbD [Planctomycetota bacterium]
MRVPSGQRRSGLRFNITPLIDVVFLLIIFFLVASHFVRTETAEAVDLPSATQEAAQVEESPRLLVITVRADGSLSVRGREATSAEVDAMIAAGHTEDGGEFEVRIRGDRSVPYRAIEPLLVSCARAGVTNVKFAVVLETR